MGEKISLIIGIVTFCSGLFSFYGGAIKKRYGAERDFQHLKNDYRALAQNVALLSDMLDGQIDSMQLKLLELRARVDLLIELKNAKDNDC